MKNLKTKVTKNLLLGVIIILVFMLGKCGGGKYQKSFSDTVTVFSTDTVTITQVVSDTIYKTDTFRLLVDNPTIIEVKSIPDTVFINPDSVRRLRVYSDTLKLDSGQLYYRAEVLGYLNLLEAKYKRTSFDINTTKTVNTTISNTTTNTITLNRNRLYFGMGIQVHSGLDADITPSLLFTTPRMGLAMDYGLINGSVQFTYYRHIRIFQRK